MLAVEVGPSQTNGSIAAIVKIEPLIQRETVPSDTQERGTGQCIGT